MALFPRGRKPTQPRIRRCAECLHERADVLWDKERDKLLCVVCWLRLPQIDGRSHRMPSDRPRHA